MPKSSLAKAEASNPSERSTQTKRAPPKSSPPKGSKLPRTLERLGGTALTPKEVEVILKEECKKNGDISINYYGIDTHAHWLCASKTGPGRNPLKFPPDESPDQHPFHGFSVYLGNDKQYYILGEQHFLKP
jgi:hypothetical protein